MFKDGDIVCFLGDSITAGGRWMAEVYQILRKKYKIKCYNCGVTGSCARKAFHYLDDECLVFKPNYVSIMFGINDIDVTLYAKDQENLPDTEKKKKEAISTCITHYRGILEKVCKSGATPIICIPVPYDNVSGSEVAVSNCQSGLDELEIHLRELAKEFGCKVVDIKKTFSKFLGKDGLMRIDRIHPTEFGHHIIAQIYLREIGEIETCNFDTPFEFEKWNEKRFEKEQSLHFTKYVELSKLFDVMWVNGLSAEDKKKMVKKLYDEAEDKESYSARGFLSYLENVDNKFKIREEIIKLTIF